LKKQKANELKKGEATMKTIAITTVAALSVIASMAPASAFYMDKANMVQGLYVRSGDNMPDVKAEKIASCYVSLTPVEAERGIRHYRGNC